MPHSKDRIGSEASERKFPHIVEIAVPLGGLGAQLDAMHHFHEARGIKACLGRGRRGDNRDYLRWYFTSLKTAGYFAIEFGGKYQNGRRK